MHASRKSLALQLCKAVNEGEPRVVEALLLQGASPNLVLPKGVAAVHLAAGKETEKRIRCLKLLLQYGADPNVRSVEDLTPVHIAALWGCYQNLKLLLQNGGNPNLEDQDGNKAADLAKQQENRRCARLLQEYHSWDALESLLSDFEDGPLSSTRRSSLLHLSQISSRPSWRGRSHLSALSDRELDWDPAAPSLFSSTRMSAGGPGALSEILPIVDEEAPLVDYHMNQPKDPVIHKTSNASFLTLGSSSFSHCTSPKSISFKDVDEYFNVFDAESPQQLEHQGSHSSEDITVDFSEYPEFLNSERMATVLQNQGIDVTSPDHVFVFSRDRHCASPDLDKTVAGHWLEEEEEGAGDDGQLAEVKNPVEPASCSSSGTSEYSNCDSDHYTTAVGLSYRDLKDVNKEPSDNLGEWAEPLPADGEMVRGVVGAFKAMFVCDGQEVVLPLTPSPFVTGRTRSRLSRCSLRNNSNSGTKILSSTSSLFEDTLPTPVRLHRSRTRMQNGSRVHDSMPSSLHGTPVNSERGEPNFADSTVQSYKTTQTNTLTLDSQADTLIISGSAADTVILRKESVFCLRSKAGPMPMAKNDCSSPEARSNPLATPASGCTPRYSISRLSACHKPQSLANLSYTAGGQPLILDQEEPVEYLYTDFEEGHELIECHVTDNLPDVSGLTDKELRNRLKDLGEDPGPISILTRPLYIQKLRQLQQEAINRQPVVHNPAGYSVELASALHTFTLPDCQADELALCQQFDQPDQNRKWREGIIKSSFNYLLLDPRVTKNLPCRSMSVTPIECFQIFIKAVFYIGKGKRSRPYSHLYEALDYYKGDKTSKKLCSKVQHILQVWRAGLGVISLHCFQNVIPVEAYTREACMVDAIGLKMLTNQKRGDYYGVVSTWPMKRRCEMGVHLLYRAMQIFLAEGERQLRPADIRVGH
uniref:Zgc:85936 n=1 Tax=Scleropages formosus TaxID=113540 RepID=A0A8C9V7W7_SCLFO